jgi:hypothetical protein
MVAMINAFKILAGKPERKKIFTRPTSKVRIGIKMDINKTGFADVGWTYIAHDTCWCLAHVNAIMNAQLS